MTTGDWLELAACAQTDPELFFPDKGGTSHAAKRVCASCEVMDRCRGLWETLCAEQRRWGIWFGTSYTDRLDYSQRLDHTCQECGHVIDAIRTYCPACSDKRRAQTRTEYEQRRRVRA